MLKITEKEVLRDKAAVISLNGTLSSETSAKLEDLMFDVLDRGIVNLIMDAENLAYISSAGLGALLSVIKSIKSKGGIFVIFGLNKEIRTLFRVLKIDETITIAAGLIDGLNTTERYIEEEFKPERSAVETYGEGLLVECKSCASLIRIKGPGSFVCPDCKSAIYATGNMTVLFE